MCTRRSPTEIMVCDVSRERVQRILGEKLGGALRFVAVPGEGTLVSCLDPVRASEFNECFALAIEAP